jgi:hypothetical protein
VKFHGSELELDIGTIVMRPENGYVNLKEPYEAFLESARPENMISRTEAVFTVGKEDDIDPAGGSTEFVYLVELIGHVQAHDMNWLTEVQICLEDDDHEGAYLNAKKYWSGEEYPFPENRLVEYIAKSFKVLELVPEHSFGV